jgi:hypothetical protein
MLFSDSQEECSPLPDKGQAESGGRRWFGGYCGRGSAILPAWLRYLRMTATATVYTSSGFAMAADGRRSWDSRPTLRSRDGESDKVKKIFEITRRDAALAYCVRGDTINENMSWDIASEMISTVAALRDKRFANSSRFIHALCLDLQSRIESARERRLLNGYPTSEMTFAG